MTRTAEVESRRVDKYGFQVDEDGYRLETTSNDYLDEAGRQVNVRRQLTDDAGNLVDESGRVLSLDELAERYPQDFSRVPKVESTSLELAKSDAKGASNAGLFTGELGGQPVFVKVLNAFDAKEIMLQQKLGELGVGPRVLATTEVDGRMALVSERIQDGIQLDRATLQFGKNAAAYRALDEDQKRSVLAQMSTMGDAIAGAGIVTQDLQFMFEPATGKLYVVDPGQFSLVEVGKVATDSKLMVDSFAKDLRENWKL